MTKRILVLILLISGPVFAQQASVSGKVVDSSNAAIQDANVRLTKVDGGAELSTHTNELGEYSLPFITAADYVLHVDAPSFTPAEKGITVLVGQAVAVDWQLTLAAVASRIEVTTSALEISTTESQVSANIDPQQMTDLPLNGRNWFELGLLLPGISKNDVANNTLFSGADYGTYQLNVDGQQVGEDIAASAVGQPRYSRDALSEFQVITNRFDATQGRASTAQINAETKSGSNTLHGGAFGYFRSDDFNAADPVAHEVLPFSDQQFGGTIGGPIRLDKLFYFGSYEGERNPYTVYTTPTNFGGTTYQIPSSNTTNMYLGKVDWLANDTNRFAFRVNAFTFSSPLSGVTGTMHPSQGGQNSLKNVAALVDWSKIKSANVVNDLKVGFNFFVYANKPVVLSQEYRFGTITVGGNYNYPSPHDEDLTQIRDGVSILKGKHDIQLGAEFLNTWYFGQYPQYSRGAVTSFSSVPANLTPYFPVWNDPSTWNIAALGLIANTYVQGFGNFTIDIHRNSVGAWIQDNFHVLPRLTLNLGLRYDNDLGLLGDSPDLKSGLAVSRVSENLNFAPRLGFAWDVFGNHTTVIRGGGGLFYSDLQANQFYDQELFNGQTTMQASVEATPGNPINLSNPFAPYTGQDFVNGTAPLPKQAVQLMDPNVQTPYTWQESIGLQHSFGSSWTIQADYVHTQTYHEWIRYDQNLSYNPATGFNVNPTTGGRPNPDFTSILRFATPSSAGATYNGLLIDVRRRFANHLYIAGSYTLAYARDDTDGVFYVPNNQFNIPDGWGPQTGTQKNTANADGSYQLPKGFELSFLYHFGSGAAYATTASGSPFANGGTNRTYLATTKVYNNPANNYPDPLDPAYMITKRNGFWGRPVHRVDMRFAKTFTFKERFNAIGQVEAFNLLNHSNFGAYQTAITSSSYGQPAADSSLDYSARTIQLSARFEF
jgi:Carboxypeptidase regulatory-like domain